MITPQYFLDYVANQGVTAIASVPCSFLAPLISAVETDRRFIHIAATSEAEAVGIGAGAWFAGEETLLLMQNSGFCDALNPIASLLCPFSIPLMFVVSGRGAFGTPDEPHHRVVGSSFDKLATLWGLPFEVMPPTEAELHVVLDQLRRKMSDVRRPSVLGVPRDGFVCGKKVDAANRVECAERDPAGIAIVRSNGAGISQQGLIEELRSIISDETIVIATTGYTARQLHEAGDRPRNLYMVGAMGCASAVGLGMSMFSEQPVMVLDGDGAAMMRMGNFATIGAVRPSRFLHVILNNGTYDSTGGQRSAGSSVDFGAVAVACGYAVAARYADTASIADFAQAVFTGALASPALLEVPTLTSTSLAPGRVSVSASDQGTRIRAQLKIDRPRAGQSLLGDGQHACV